MIQAALVVFMRMNRQKLKMGLNVVPLMTMRVILSGKIMIQGKSLCLVLDVGLVQLLSSECVFIWKLKLGL